MESDPHRAAGGPPAFVYILGLGAVEVAFIYVMVAVDTPFSAFASRAAETWPGRIMLALLGWLFISAGMIVMLTVLERRRARKPPAP